MTTYGIHTNILDFDIIEDGNPKTLVFLDKSTYIDDAGPEKPVLEVVSPGFQIPVTIAIIPNQVNVLNSGLLKLTTGTTYGDLADGLYWLTYRICPYDQVWKTKIYLKTTILEYRYQNALLTLDNSPYWKINDPQIQQSIAEYMIAIETAKANSQVENTTKATEYYKLANKIVNNLVTKCHSKPNNFSDVW
jgi:hypothetical protein